MSDCIIIRDLEVWTNVGITKEERSSKQRLLVSVKIVYDLSKTGVSDDILQTIDYDDACKKIQEAMKEERNTIEKVAEDIANLLKKTYAPTAVRIEVKKFVIPKTGYVGVCIER